MPKSSTKLRYLFLASLLLYFLVGFTLSIHVHPNSSSLEDQCSLCFLAQSQHALAISTQALGVIFIVVCLAIASSQIIHLFRYWLPLFLRAPPIL